MKLDLEKLLRDVVHPDQRIKLHYGSNCIFGKTDSMLFFVNFEFIANAEIIAMNAENDVLNIYLDHFDIDDSLE